MTTEKKPEVFPYEVDEGSVTDFVDGRFVLVVKDSFWSDEELALFAGPIDLHFAYTNDIALFIVEGGPLDSGDFYFNVQECDERENLLSQDLLSAELLLIDGANQIRAKRAHNFSKEESRQILELLRQQNEAQFMPGEYEVNVEGLQSAYEPYDLEKFSKVSVKL